MKNKIIIYMSVGLVILLFFNVYLLYTNRTFLKNVYASKTYRQVNIAIPKYSYFIDDCCDAVATFSSLRSVTSIEKDIHNYLSTLERKDCYNKEIYYDSKQNLVIFEYDVKQNFQFSLITINYNYDYDINCK